MQIGGVMRVRLVTAEPDETAAEAIRRMLETNVGSVVVCEGTVPVGIFTERDVLRLAGAGADFETTVLRDTMTPNPLTVSAEVGILEAAQLMGARRLRHLPVVEGAISSASSRSATCSASWPSACGATTTRQRTRRRKRCSIAA